MNWLKKTAIVLGLVAVVGGAGTFAYAQTVDNGAFTANGSNRAGITDFQFTQDGEGAPRGNRGGERDGQRGPRGEGNELRGIIDRGIMMEATADALGITREDLEASRENGQSLLDLATAQGVSMAEVEEAVQTAVTDSLNQAVADGTLTQEQADQFMANMALRELAKEFKESPEVKEAVADALGITVAEFDEAKEAGTRLDELANAQGVDIETVKEAGKTAFEGVVNQAVEDGTLTQEQADEILSGSNGRRGGHRGQGGPRGEGAPQPPAEQTNLDA